MFRVQGAACAYVTLGMCNSPVNLFHANLGHSVCGPGCVPLFNKLRTRATREPSGLAARGGSASMLPAYIYIYTWDVYTHIYVYTQHICIHVG